MITLSYTTLLRRLRRAAAVFTGTTRLHGVRLTTDKSLQPEIIRRALFSGTYEKPECRLVRQYVTPGDRVLEIGAGIGLVGIVAAKASGGPIVICEPNPAVAALIRENYRLNNITPHFIETAVTSDGRDVTLLQDNCIFGSTLLERKHRRRDFTPVKLGSIAINDLVAEHRPDVLIMDVEGAEVEILDVADLSGIQTLIIEVHAFAVGEEEIGRILQNLTSGGFTIQAQIDHSICLQRR